MTLFQSFYWLRLPERMAVLVYRCLRGLAPRYLKLRLHPARRRFQTLPSPVVVILTAGDPTYTAVHCWRLCISGD